MPTPFKHRWKSSEIQVGLINMLRETTGQLYFHCTWDRQVLTHLCRQRERSGYRIHMAAGIQSAGRRWRADSTIAEIRSASQGFTLPYSKCPWFCSRPYLGLSWNLSSNCRSWCSVCSTAAGGRGQRTECQIPRDRRTEPPDQKVKTWEGEKISGRQE